ncbi:hypothetical protein ACHAQA_007620 [Verticillium albo-atrum]
MPPFLRRSQSTPHGISFVGLNSRERSTAATIVLQKFLRAADYDVETAVANFSATMRWRKKYDPSAKLAKMFDPKRFGDMGFITRHRIDEHGRNIVVMWNLYGVIKDVVATFGDIRQYLDFSIALMELAVRALQLTKARTPIPDLGPDPYKIVQVHDCAGSDPFEVYPRVKVAIARTIDLMDGCYPGLLAYHHFVRLGCLNTFRIKLLNTMVPGSLRARVLSLGRVEFKTSLKREDVLVKLFPDPADRQRYAFSFPSEFGGTAGSVHEGKTVFYLKPDDSSARRQLEFERALRAAEEDGDLQVTRHNGNLRIVRVQNRSNTADEDNGGPSQAPRSEPKEPTTPPSVPLTIDDV